jgi:L-threonate 2-dehydrogenase
MFRDYPAANLDTHVDSGDSAMISSVAVIAPGAMGSAVAYRLSAHGIHVLTSLRGRGPQTLRRAVAKMQDADDDAIARADVILSILPPAEALALAERFAAPLSKVQRKAIFVDCNAVNVQTVRWMSLIIEPTGASFVDGSIIGHPPDREGGPTFYFSGSAAKELAAFEGLGLKVRIMEAPIGAASALKMAYAGINKGITLLVTAMVLGAARAGAAEALHEELAESQRGLLDRMAHTIPDMFPKAYRWGPEMEEIAGFIADDPTTSRIYGELATLCRRFAADCSGEGVEIARLNKFLSGSPSPPAAAPPARDL